MGSLSNLMHLHWGICDVGILGQLADRVITLILWYLKSMQFVESKNMCMWYSHKIVQSGHVKNSYTFPFSKVIGWISDLCRKAIIDSCYHSTSDCLLHLEIITSCTFLTPSLYSPQSLTPSLAANLELSQQAALDSVRTFRISYKLGPTSGVPRVGLS